MDHLPKSAAARVFEAYTSFEKQHGDRAGIEAVVLGKRRVAYAEAVAAAPDASAAFPDGASSSPFAVLDLWRQLLAARDLLLAA